MKKYNIWSEGYYATGMENTCAKAQLIASDIEGEDFLDAITRWYNQDPERNERGYGKLSIEDGIPRLWGCRLFDNEEEARESFG